MSNPSNQKFIIITLSALSMMLALASSYATYMGDAVSEMTFVIWSAVFALMIAFWTSIDARSRALYTSFDYAYLIFVFWPVFLPYHLIKTRGYEGFLMFAGIAALYLLPFISELVIWAGFVQ